MNQTRYFSDIHTSKASQLAGEPVTVGDSPAITELRAALSDYPGDYNLRLQLAHQLGQQLRYREAIEVLTAAVALQPDNPAAYRRRAPRYYSTLQFREAYIDYRFCDTAAPGSLDILYRLGILCVAMGRYPEAKERLARCIPLTENDGEMRIAVLFWYLAAYLRCSTADEPNLAAEAYSPELATGHHFAYRAAVELLLGRATLEETLAAADAGVDDLDHSMLLYGVYLHHIARGAREEAGAALERLLGRDRYWAGFAYISALSDSRGPNAVSSSLASLLREIPAAALAFSGGADSAYLLYCARACGCRVRAYYLHSAFQPAFELEDARRLAAELGADLTVLELDMLSQPEIADNPPDRCYYCKRAIFSNIASAARADGFTVLLDGTNASDDANDRPGTRALKELGVRSPLREAGVTKARLRELSRQAGLFTWDKPAYACLATRVPTGRAITARDLAAVEWGEDALLSMGFTNLRLRLSGGGVILQLPENNLDRLMKMRHTVYETLSASFDPILLDLKPRL